MSIGEGIAAAAFFISLFGCISFRMWTDYKLQAAREAADRNPFFRKREQIPDTDLRAEKQ